MSPAPPLRLGLGGECLLLWIGAEFFRDEEGGVSPRDDAGVQFVQDKFNTDPSPGSGQACAANLGLEHGWPSVCAHRMNE